MWLNFKFTLQFSLNSIQKNLLRSISIVFSIILILSTTISLLGWLEEAPTNAINAAFDRNKRAYDIKTSEIYYREGGLETLQGYLETEKIVESTEIIHRSIFLYNLNNRSHNFSVLNPQTNQSNFYISRDDLTNGLFFVSNNFLNQVAPLLVFENNSEISFGENSTKVIVSRRMLTSIEEATNHSLEIGSPINFSIAGQFLPQFAEELIDLNPIAFQNLTVGAIYDRVPSQTQVAFSLEFYHETLGDGMFISDQFLMENVTFTYNTTENMENAEGATLLEVIEENGFFPTLFIQLNRSYLTQLPINDIIPEIDFLTARIYQQGRYRIEVQIAESQSLLYIFNQSYFVLLLLLLPILLCSEIFFCALIPHLINSRIEEYSYLRLKGTTDGKILVIGFTEFIFLNVFGVIGGILGGQVLLDILLATSEFLKIPKEFFYERGRELIETQSNVWITGVFIVLIFNSSYFLFLLQRTIKRLHQFDLERNNTRILSTSRPITSVLLRLLIAGLIGYLILTVITPGFLNELDSQISTQLIPLISVFLMGLWIIFSFYIPQFGLRIIQSIFELRILKNPKRKITWVNLFRRRTQFIGLLALITLTVSLFTFSVVYEETVRDNNTKNAAYFIGGDLKLVTDNVNTENFSALLSNITGISSCIGFPYRAITIARYSMVIIGIEPDSYNEISSLYPESIIEGPPPTSFWHSLSEDPLHSVIVNGYMTNVFKWNLDSTIEVLDLLTGYGAIWNLSIKGILNSAPGIGSLFPGEHLTGSSMFGGYGFVHKELLEAFGTNTTTNFLIRLNSTNQKQSVINQLEEIKEIRMIYESTSVEKSQQDFYNLIGVQGLLTINALGAVIIAILGVAVFYQYLVNERLQEFAIFQAFGATKRKISRLVFNESLFLISLGIILGMITGYLFAIGFLVASRTVTISPDNIFLLELAVSPTVLGLGLITIGVIILVVSLIPTFKVYSHQITHLLREL